MAESVRGESRPMAPSGAMDAGSGCPAPSRVSFPIASSRSAIDIGDLRAAAVIQDATAAECTPRAHRTRPRERRASQPPTSRGRRSCSNLVVAQLIHEIRQGSGAGRRASDSMGGRASRCPRLQDARCPRRSAGPERCRPWGAAQGAPRRVLDPSPRSFHPPRRDAHTRMHSVAALGSQHAPCATLQHIGRGQAEARRRRTVWSTPPLRR